LRKSQVVDASGAGGPKRLVTLRPDPGEVASVRGHLVTWASLGQAGIRVLPWLLALGVACAALLQTGTPAVDIARYGAYWGFALTLPGLLLVRATIGTRGNWAEDVALGAVTGLGKGCSGGG
jgi:hypothetical protein